MLIGAVIVRAVGDQRRQAVGLDIGAHEVVACRLARGVGRIGTVRRRFGERGSVNCKRAIDLVGRDMEKAAVVERSGRAPGVERGLEQREGSEHVGLQECFGIGDRTVDMRFRGKMGDAGELVFVEQPPHQRRVPDVALDEQDASIGDQRFEAADIGGIGHRVDDDQPVGRPRGAPCVNQVLADEARAAGDQNALHRNLWVALHRNMVPGGGKSLPSALKSTASGGQTYRLASAAKLVIFRARSTSPTVICCQHGCLSGK